ncbi:DJ-1 family glyoxalase III, partial [Treponema endosymbiont of Eucomonympha sp.]
MRAITHTSGENVKRVLVFFAEGCEEIEAVTLVDYLRRASAGVISASCSDSLALIGSHGIKLCADTTAARAFKETGAFDAVVAPGGMPGAANIAACPEAVSIIEKTRDAGGITAAICAAPVVVFAKLGLLAGKTYTCYPGMEREFPKWAGADWEKRTAYSVKKETACWQDGNLVTGEAPGAAEPFALLLVELLCGREAAAA